MMTFSTFSFHLKETICGFRRSAVMTLTTISTVSVSLMILGSFLLFFENMNLLLRNLQSQLHVNFYLQDNIPENDLRTLITTLKSDPRIRDFEIISKEKSLLELKEELGPDAKLLENLPVNPLPNTVAIFLNPTEDLSGFRQTYRDFAIIEDFAAGQDWVEKVLSIINTTKKIGLAIIILLGFAGLSIISNTIRLTIFARRQEIEIMRLVGATNWFIRVPFLMEGILQGLIGALIAIGFLIVGYSFFQQQIVNIFPELKLLNSFAELSEIYLRIFFLGIALGFLGSIMSLRRFLV
jgi:cell division transport system permease protein